MAQEYQGIIAGISTAKENEIQPSFDAGIYDFIVGQDGHALSFKIDGTTIISNGFVIADGVRAFFNNAAIDGNVNGYLYAELTMHHNTDEADSAILKWSATELSEQHDNIGSTAGLYRMLILEVVGLEATVRNLIYYPHQAYYADEADVVTGYLANGVTAITQPNENNSDLVATTKFVHNVLNQELNAGQTNVALQNITGTGSQVLSLKKQGGYAVGQLSIRGTLTDSGNQQIGTIPVGYRPTTSIETAIGYEGNNRIMYLQIDTDGAVKLNYPANNNFVIDTTFGYECN